MTYKLSRSLSHRPPKVVFSTLFIIVFLGTFSVFNLAQSDPQPAIMGTTSSSNRVVVFPDPGNQPNTQILVPGLPANANPHGVAYFDSDRALVSDFNTSRIFLVRVSTGTLLATIDTSAAPAYNGTGSIAVSPDGQTALAVGNNDQLIVIRAPFNNQSIRQQITLPGLLDSFQTQAIVFDNTGRAFVNTRFGISVIDPPYASVSFTMAHNVLQTYTGALAISPDGSTLLLTRATNAVRIYDAPFSSESVPVVRLFPANESIGLSGIMITPDGNTAITVSAGNYRAFFMHAPFTASSVIEDIPLPVDNSGSFEDVGISADGRLAILTGNGIDQDLPAVLIRAPFTAAKTETLNLPVGGVANPSRGAGAVRFVPPGHAPGLSISISGPSSVWVGGNLTYTINYANTGSQSSENTIINAPLPVGTTFVSASDGGQLIDGNVVFNVGTVVPAGVPQTVSFTVNVTAPGGQSLIAKNYTIAAAGIFPVYGLAARTAVFGVGSCSTPDVRFVSLSPSEIPLATGLRTIVTGDFNNDGNLDFAFTGLGQPGVISVLLGDGLGTFTPPATPPVTVQTNPEFMVAADVNNDGNLDLLVVNTQSQSSSVSVRLGDGNGGFAPPAVPEIAVGTQPTYIAVGDFNNDGNIDFITANNASGQNSVSIRLGNGIGGFTSPAVPEIAVGTQPWAVAVGDFNNDGNLDFVATNNSAISNNVSIRLGDGQGGFTSPAVPQIPVGSSPRGIAVADFNNDGNLDFAVANQQAGNVSIRLGNGLGGFTSPVVPQITAGSSPRTLVIEDLNNDGNKDLVIVNLGSSMTSIRLGDGNGGFSLSAEPEIPVGRAPYHVAVGDFNNDEKIDLAVIGAFLEGFISVRYGACVGGTSELTLSPPTANVPVGGTQQFSVSGGTAPYTFSIFQNQSGGSIDPGTGFYTAGAVAGTDTIRVTDAENATAEATVTVVQPEPLAISPQIATLPAGGTQQFTANGGTAPYSFTILQNQSGGSINAETGLYTAGPNPGTDIVRVTDDEKATADATVTVILSDPLEISPQAATINAGGTQQFAASGGTAPYSFTIFQNQSGGSINAETGFYTAGPNPGTDIVRVTDSAGANDDAFVTVELLACLTPPPNLVAWWRGEGNAVDIMGGPGGTLEGGATFAPGHVGQAFDLNGTDASVLLPSLNLGNAYTVEFWANLRTGSLPTFTHIVSNSWTATGFGTLYLRNNRSFTYYYGGTPVAKTAAEILPVGEFAHVALTRAATDGLTRIYVNGLLAATSSNTSSVAFNNQVRLGYSVDSESSRFPGLIDEATFYNRTLSQAEIQAIHAAGEGGKCAPLFMSPQTVTLGTGGFQQFEANGGTAPYTFSIVQNETGASINPDTGFYLAGQTPGTDIVRVTDSNNSSLDSTVTVLQCLTLPNGIAGWWKGEGNTADAMGGPSGTLEGGATFAPGHVGEAFDLNGTDASVLLPTMDLGNAFTIELWANLRNIPQFTQFIALVSNNSSDSGYGSLFVMNDGHLLYQGGLVSAATAPGILPVGQFTHIALTRDATDGRTRIYVNGALAATSTATSFVPFNNPVRLGFSIIGAHARFNGLIDEATFYSRTLSQSEIEAIHAVGQGGKCFTPTSAPASVSGRVLTSDGRGLARTRVTLTDVKGTTRVAQTNAFGYFAFDDVRVGESYVLAVSHRSYQFEEPERVITVDDDITGIVFSAIDGRKPGGL